MQLVKVYQAVSLHATELFLFDCGINQVGPNVSWAVGDTLLTFIIAGFC